MPDVTRRTVSASQVAALFGRSPYLTRWMLWQHFKNELPLGSDETDRMSWGNRLEPAIIKAVADELRLDVVPNRRYDVAPNLPLGCTRDADLIDPSLGYGAVEVKNVDALIYRQQWDEEHAPPHIEIQHQAQMMVPHPTHGMPKWGVIAALVGGNELKILRRTHEREMQKDIGTEAIKFIQSLSGQPPDPLGTERELRGLKWLYPARAPEKIISNHEADFVTAVENYESYRTQRLELEKLEKALRVQILNVAQDAQIVNAGPFLIQLKEQTRPQVTTEATTFTRMTIKRTDMK